MGLTFSQCGKHFRVRIGSLTVHNPENIQIGSCFSSLGYLFLYGNEGFISIGDNCSINTNVQIGASGGRIIIGNNVLIGPNVVIRAADHVFSDPKILIREQGHAGGDIIIEDDVWICANCVITKSVRIGRGSIIAAGSIVTKDVEPLTIIAGVPANKIKSRAAISGCAEQGCRKM